MNIQAIKIAACATCLLLSLSASALAAVDKGNDGQDPTRPLTRFDIRTLYTSDIKLPNNETGNQTVVLGRIDKPMPMDNKWVFYWRLDVPIVNNDIPSADNPNRDRQTGMGNIFNQFIWIMPGGKYPLGIQTLGMGFQLKLDTASQDQFGNGRNTYVPLFAWKWQLSDTVGVIPVFKYEKAFGHQPFGQNNEVENFQFKPIVNIKLPDKWFISFWDSTDWVLQRNGGKDDGDWNIPLDIMIGKRSGACGGFSDVCVYSFQVIEPVVEQNDFETSDTAYQFRVGFFFD